MLDRNSRRRGSALILVMGVLVLLSIIGTAFVLLMRIEARAARNFVEAAETQLLAKEALAYVLEHPSWNPPTGTDIDNDNAGGPDSAFFTHPLSDYTGNYHARWAILKKRFNGRVNINWNSFFERNGTNTDGQQIMNEGSSPNEISLEKAIAAYLNAPTVGPIDMGYFPAARKSDSIRIAHEIAGRICNYRYGESIGSPPTPPYPFFHGDPPPGSPGPTGVSNFPGMDSNAEYADALGVLVSDGDTRFLDDTKLYFENDATYPGVLPDRRSEADRASWAYSDPSDPLAWASTNPPRSLNWRPDPAYDMVDENGNGLFDEIASADSYQTEWLNNPQEFLQKFNPASWRIQNNDTPFGSSDLQAIIFNTGNPPIKAIVNDVFWNWAPAQVNPTNIPGYGDTNFDYFDLLRPLFTTDSSDFVNKEKFVPINYLNILAPAGVPVPGEVVADRNAFRAAMLDVLEEGGMRGEPAEDTSWQILANLIDYLDEDVVLGSTEGILTTLVNSGGKTFHGTERQPYLNEFWKYNRGSDKFDNDGNGKSDVTPFPNQDMGEVGHDAYFVELANLYATPITLYNNPGAGNGTIDWYLRVLNPGGVEVYRVRASQLKYWNGAAWTPCAGASRVEVPRGGYLVVESQDYTRPAVTLHGDNDQLATHGRLLLDPTAPPANTALFNIMTDNVIFTPGDTVELVYSYDYTPIGSTVSLLDEAVIDRQTLPGAMGGIPGATYDFKPSYERQDPRLAKCVRTALKPLLMETMYSLGGGLNNDYVRNTLGEVNDNGDGDSGADGDVFDGNYDLRSTDSRLHPVDDLVDVPNRPTWKFGNVGGLGKLLSVGPMPPTPPAGGSPGHGWTGSEWLYKNSPYTAVFDATVVRPLDAKKINFIDSSDSTLANPRGRTTAIFDRFTTLCPWKDGRDNDGEWTVGADDADGNGGPTPGEPGVDDSKEQYVYGRVDVNQTGPDADATLAALPLVILNDEVDGAGMLVNLPQYYFDDTNVALWPFGKFYLRATTDPNSIQKRKPPSGRFSSRKQFYESVVLNAIAGASFGRDGVDNNIYKDYATNTLMRRTSATAWGTIQRPPRTKAIVTDAARALPYDFILPGAAAPGATQEDGNGGDLLVDDKSEIDYTAGALMNEIAVESELPQELAVMGGVGVVTYYITVQITDGGDVAPGGPVPPDWTKGNVLAEKRIVVLVDNSRPSTDPKRIMVFNWATEGNYLVR